MVSPLLSKAFGAAGDKELFWPVEGLRCSDSPTWPAALVSGDKALTGGSSRLIRHAALNTFRIVAEASTRIWGPDLSST